MRSFHPPVVALLAATSLFAACRDAKKPPVRPAPAPMAAVVPAVANPGASAEAAAPEWSYSSVGKRDPFRSFLADLTSVEKTASTRCSTPLGRFELEQLKLVAVVTGLDDPVAMVEAPGGVGYSLKRGACVGRNGGVVSVVRSGEVVVSEWAIRADGTRDKTQTILRLPKEASLHLEE